MGPPSSSDSLSLPLVSPSDDDELLLLLLRQLLDSLELSVSLLLLLLLLLVVIRWWLRGLIREEYLENVVGGVGLVSLFQ